MSKYLLIVAGLIAAVGVVWTEPVAAHGQMQWSVTVGSPGYYYRSPGYYNYYYQAPGVIVYPQPNYYYGVPPTAIVPPPAVYYPPPVYKYYYPQSSGRLNAYPYGYGNKGYYNAPHWQHGGNGRWNR